MGGGVFEGKLVQAICHTSPSPATKAVRHFLRHHRAENAVSLGETTIRNHPTRGAFFAGSRTGSHVALLRKPEDPCGGKHRPLQYSLDDRAGNALSPIERWRYGHR